MGFQNKKWQKYIEQGFSLTHKTHTCADNFRAQEATSEMPTLTKIYSMEEASQHNTSEDCWVVIDGKVYDVSSYMDEHPGGDDVLLRATGKDATEEFEDAGHSKTAREQMEEFCIGELDELPPPIPEMEIVSKKQGLKDLPQKVLNLSKQYWVAPVAVVGLSLVVGFLYLRKRQHI